MNIPPELYKFMPDYSIDSHLRRAGFIAQAAHESGMFSRLTENLNYSADGLLGTWPKRFTIELAKKYAHQPEKIANYVYANRMGNGPESSGDGWKHRGHGLIQLTGKDNIGLFAKHIGKSIDETLAYLKTMEGACHSACWYWQTRGLNRCADARDIEGMTKGVNGGLIGLKKRKAIYQELLKSDC